MCRRSHYLRQIKTFAVPFVPCWITVDVEICPLTARFELHVEHMWICITDVCHGRWRWAWLTYNCPKDPALDDCSRVFTTSRGHVSTAPAVPPTLKIDYSIRFVTTCLYGLFLQHTSFHQIALNISKLLDIFSSGKHSRAWSVKESALICSSIVGICLQYIIYHNTAQTKYSDSWFFLHMYIVCMCGLTQIMGLSAWCHFM